MSVKKVFPNRPARKTAMDWKRYYLIVICLMIFVLGVHIFTVDQPVGVYNRHKRDTSSQTSDDNSTITSNSSDPLSVNEESSSISPTFDSFGVTDKFQNTSVDITEISPKQLNENVSLPVQDPSQTTKSPNATVSIPNILNKTSTKVPNNVSDQDVTTETNAQANTADNIKPSVINTTSLPTMKPTPPLELSTRETIHSTEDSVVIIPQTNVPPVHSSTAMPTTTTAVIFVNDDGNDEEGSLNLMAIVLPIAIFLLLVVVLIACICCCKRGAVPFNCCPKGKPQRGKRKKENGNDLWVEDGGIDNVAVMNGEEEFRGEKDSEADSVVISAQSYGGKLYEVDYGFEAAEDSHLGLAPGSIVEVVEKLDSGWWRGYVGENEGWFPATYVHTLDKQHASSPGAHAAVNQGFDIEEELKKIRQEKTENEKLRAQKEEVDVESSPVSLQDKLLKAITQEVGRKHQYIAIADYVAENSDELSIKRGESLTHLNKDPGGWTRVKHDSSAGTGWVPSSYIQEVADGDDVFVDEKDKTNNQEEEYYDDDDDLDETVDWEAEFDEDQDELTGIEHNAIHPYEAQQEGDLSFKAGDTVIVFEMLANGWWRGCSEGQEGWFPATYVEAVAQTPRSSDNLSQMEFSLVPQNKRVSIHMEKNIEYPDTRDSSLERRMLADKKEKENDPLYSPTASPGDKPVIPVRFVTPKLVRVNRGTLKRSAHKLRRPRRPAPPPPAGIEPYRTLTKHSLPRRKRKPPPPPKRTSASKMCAYPVQPPPPPQRTVAPKLVMPKNLSPSNTPSTTSPQSPPKSPEDDSATNLNRPAPTRPAPPAPSAILEARKQSIASEASTGSFIPPPPMFMDTMQKENEETKAKRPAPPKPAKRTSITSNKLSESDVEKVSVHQSSPPAPGGRSDDSAPTNSFDWYSSIDSKDSNSSWGQGSSLDKKDRPVMAVKPVMKFVQSDAWKQDIKRSSSSVPHSGNVTSTNQEGRHAPEGQASTSGPVSANTMRVVPQRQTEQYTSPPKTRPNPPARKSISDSTIPLQEIHSRNPGAGRQDSRPSTSSTDSSKPAPPRPPPPRPTGPPPQHSGVAMRNKSNEVRRKSTLRRAAQSYHSAEKGHLSFQEDSFIKELGEVPGKTGWMLGMLADGTTGIYPKSCVEEIQGVRVSRV